jgi:hypothetical protein
VLPKAWTAVTLLAATGTACEDRAITAERNIAATNAAAAGVTDGSTPTATVLDASVPTGPRWDAAPPPECPPWLAEKLEPALGFTADGGCSATLPVRCTSGARIVTVVPGSRASATSLRITFCRNRVCTSGTPGVPSDVGRVLVAGGDAKTPRQSIWIGQSGNGLEVIGDYTDAPAALVDGDLYELKVVVAGGAALAELRQTVSYEDRFVYNAGWCNVHCRRPR